MFELVSFTPGHNYGRYTIEITDYEGTQRFSISTTNSRLYDEYTDEATREQATQTAIKLVMDFYNLKHPDHKTA